MVSLFNYLLSYFIPKFYCFPFFGPTLTTKERRKGKIITTTTRLSGGSPERVVVGHHGRHEGGKQTFRKKKGMNSFLSRSHPLVM